MMEAKNGSCFTFVRLGRSCGLRASSAYQRHDPHRCLQELSSHRRNRVWKTQLPLLDVPKQLHVVRIIERRQSRQHLVQHRSNPIYVGFFSDGEFIKHLWRNVSWGAAECVFRQLLLSQLLGQSEVRQLDVSVSTCILVQRSTEEDVVSFHVAVDDVVFVEVLDGEDKFGRVETCLALGEYTACCDQFSQISSITIIQDKE